MVGYFFAISSLTPVMIQAAILKFPQPSITSSLPSLATVRAKARHCPVFTRGARPPGVRASRDGARWGRLLKVRLVLAMALLAGAAGLAMPALASQARGTQPRETEADA
jgi:hypothetical protein